MVGITSYGAYIPWSRLERKEIARAWERPASRGERSVANYDEDSITMAVEAGLDCASGRDRHEIDGLFFASTSSPYKEKQCSAVVAVAVDLDKTIRTADYANSLRAGTTALRAALDAVTAGSAKSVLVTSAECRLGYPQSANEANFGDGAAALLIEGGAAAVIIEDSYSISDEITDVWRRDEDKFVRNWEDRWVLTYGYAKNVREAVSGIMKRNKLTPKDFSKAVLYGPDERSHADLARSLGFDAAQVQEPLLSSIGNVGTVHSLMVLVAALEEASPGDRILLGSYGDGSDAFILRVTDGIEKIKDRRGVKRHLASKRMLPSYEKYVRYRELLPTETEAGLRLVSSATVMWRTQNWTTRFHGSKCKRCGMVTFPIHRVCFGCRAKDEYEEVRLSDKKGKLFTYTLDNLAGGIDPPVVQSIVESDEGAARIYCTMTDVDPKDVKIGMPVEMTFRRMHEGGGFHNYFWKCRPIR